MTNMTVYDVLRREAYAENQKNTTKRTRFNTADYEKLYSDIFKILRAANKAAQTIPKKEEYESRAEKRLAEGYVLQDEIINALDIKKSRLAAALKHGRRQFATGRIKVTQYIMASPEGLFLPTSEDDPRIFAYAAQQAKGICSRTTTFLPLYKKLLVTKGDEMYNAFEVLKDGADIEDDANRDIDPAWAVYNTIMSNVSQLEYDYDDYDGAYEWED